MGWKTKTFLSIIIAIPTGLFLSNTYFAHKSKEEWHAAFETYPQRAKNCPTDNLCLTIRNRWQLNIPKNDPQIFVDEKKLKEYRNLPSYSSAIIIEPGNRKNYVRFEDLSMVTGVKANIHVQVGIKISKESENKFLENKEGIFEAEIDPKNRQYIEADQHYYIFNHDCKKIQCRFQFFIDDPEKATGALFYGTDTLTGLQLKGYLTQRGINNYSQLLTEVSNDITRWSSKQTPIETTTR